MAKYETKTNLQETSQMMSKKEAWMRQENDMKKEETIAESGRIFIRNLAYTVTEEELEALFSPYGPLAEIHLPIDKHTRKIKVLKLFSELNIMGLTISNLSIKGFAFVTYVLPEHAVVAYTALDGNAFQGRMLHLIAGKSKVNDDDNDGQLDEEFIV